MVSSALGINGPLLNIKYCAWWKSKTHSEAGRAAMIKSIALALLICAMQSNDSLANELDSIAREFWKSTEMNTALIAKIELATPHGT
ncbi:hypothetical protein TorRG33x02_245500 [Trema orientale]|uniref:Uncharacterized protein n=1 Tax=Trema orientale TaxID=63057 RepID=A0A2P5DPQ5_TREOI|nr:hypothetical protein TorRG33x02_245500 [Trema orientale]